MDIVGLSLSQCIDPIRNRFLSMPPPEVRVRLLLCNFDVEQFGPEPTFRPYLRFPGAPELMEAWRPLCRRKPSSLCGVPGTWLRTDTWRTGFFGSDGKWAYLSPRPMPIAPVQQDLVKEMIDELDRAQPAERQPGGGDEPAPEGGGCEEPAFG